MTANKQYQFCISSSLSGDWFVRLEGDSESLHLLDFAPIKKTLKNKSSSNLKTAPKYVFELKKRLEKYFEGKDVLFNDVPLELSKAPPFFRKIWKELLKVKRGELVTYQGLSRKVKVNHGARAVGNAMNKNPFPIIIPCHRVIRKDGSLGGYAKGLDVKKKILNLEGIQK